MYFLQGIPENPDPSILYNETNSLTGETNPLTITYNAFEAPTGFDSSTGYRFNIYGDTGYPGFTGMNPPYIYLHTGDYNTNLITIDASTPPTEFQNAGVFLRNLILNTSDEFFTFFKIHTATEIYDYKNISFTETSQDVFDFNVTFENTGFFPVTGESGFISGFSNRFLILDKQAKTIATSIFNIDGFNYINYISSMETGNSIQLQQNTTGATGTISFIFSLQSISTDLPSFFIIEIDDSNLDNFTNGIIDFTNFNINISNISYEIKSPYKTKSIILSTRLEKNTFLNNVDSVEFKFNNTPLPTNLTVVSIMQISSPIVGTTVLPNGQFEAILNISNLKATTSLNNSKLNITIKGNVQLNITILNEGFYEIAFLLVYTSS